VSSSLAAERHADPPVRPADVVAARATLQPIIRQTPLLESGVLSALVGGPVYLKCENL
jgi:threonine dehydratase